jgi:hypothetical protein
LIASRVSVALGAPCFFGVPGDGDSVVIVGEFFGVTVSDGVGLGVGDLGGVSIGSGVGEDFFFRFRDALGDGEAEGFFFLIDGVTDGAGDSRSVDGEAFLLGEGLGEVEALFAVDELFFFRGFGVGVGVEKTFLIVAPNDCSAPRAGATVEAISASAIRTRINMTEV